MDTIHGSGKNKNGRSKEEIGTNKTAVLKIRRCVHVAVCIIDPWQKLMFYIMLPEL